MEKRIKKVRRYMKETQPLFAERLGISVRTMIKYEKDASSITIKMVKNIAHTCNIDEIWLLTGQGEMVINDGETDTSNENVVDIDLAHGDVIKKFKDKKLAKRINEQLVEIEEINEDVFRNIASIIETNLNTAKIMTKKNTPKKKERCQALYTPFKSDY